MREPLKEREKTSLKDSEKTNEVLKTMVLLNKFMKKLIYVTTNGKECDQFIDIYKTEVKDNQYLTIETRIHNIYTEKRVYITYTVRRVYITNVKPK